MKKLFVVLGLAMSAVSFQASAANFTLDLTDFSETFGKKVTGAFSHDYSFTVPSNLGGSAHLGNTTFSGLQKILGFGASLDGVGFTAEKDGNVFELHLNEFLSLATNATHHLIVSGTGITGKSASYGGTIAIVEEQSPGAVTPIPAAVWLFGSALMGLMGVKRRKTA
jgi:hypothetical protein